MYRTLLRPSKSSMSSWVCCKVHLGPRIKYILKLCGFQERKTGFKNLNKTGVLKQYKQVFQLKPGDRVPEYEGPLLANRRRTGSQFVPAHLCREHPTKKKKTWGTLRNLRAWRLFHVVQKCTKSSIHDILGDRLLVPGSQPHPRKITHPFKMMKTLESNFGGVFHFAEMDGTLANQG